jgi:hypothetical protein
LGLMCFWGEPFFRSSILESERIGMRSKPTSRKE